MNEFFSGIWRRFRVWLAGVTAVDVGKAGDALVSVRRSGTPLDLPWGQLREDLGDALEAWRTNPLAKRLVGIVTAYVIGSQGIELRAARGEKSWKLFDSFLKSFMTDPENRMAIRQVGWCDELSRSGELFPTLHFRRDGGVYVRAMPASLIERIEWMPGDYEAETVYHQVGRYGEEGRLWLHPRVAPLDLPEDGKPEPVMLHYAVNRPVGCVRGQSDLYPILEWLKRYTGWLEDRTRLNAAVRKFLWIVRVAGHLVEDKAKQYENEPAPGSVVVTDRDSEEWEAVAPDLHARDAEADGRAIRWMIVAGGPGLSLLDVGESETANLASAKTLSEQRRRFLRLRQAYFAYVLADVAVQAWNQAVAMGLRRGRQVTVADVEVGLPDIAPDDNYQLALAASAITQAMGGLQEMVGQSGALRRLALRMLLKFAGGETVSDGEFEQIVGGAFAASDDGDGESVGERDRGNGRVASLAGDNGGGVAGLREGGVKADIYRDWRSVF